MNFMNEFEIQQACDMFSHHTVLARASQFLQSFAEEVNNNSDGWPYWSAPVRSANKLMTLLQDARRATSKGISFPITGKDVDKALSPIKAFYTNRGYASGMKWPEVSE